ncbi:flagellar attachment zone protein 1 isoform X2 [Nasonia vitripennis]|uniref:Protein fantom n=1 Tax=Nasonia vitripennis TaxID=7425 RepID=A0A7M7QAJ1_NASVI|nr:flagellar attachment zone protein 1 isoform X2 [Nasonia vitripennis]
MQHHPVTNEQTASSSCADTCRCCSLIDPRERHVVCKLERYELEDRYLRLLEEVRSLKKLSNGQEDKIKRLATKLARFGSNPRNCLDLAIAADEQERLSMLEAENAQLKDKISLLRSQLVNHKIFGRSSSRGRRIVNGSAASGPITCRSAESGRPKASPTTARQCRNARPATDLQHDVQNYSLKMQEIETEKKDMMSRIAELELELASYASGERRTKVAENVEYIRLWRQLKQQNEKLVAAQTANEMLNAQIFQLKSLLEESNKKKQASAELAAERRQVAQLEASVSKYRESEVQARERDERIKDLSSELAILKQHNSELLELSSQFGRVEQENAESRRRLGEQASEQRQLRDSLAKEKASVAALQAANEQLLAKLHELQKSIDVMTIQLMALREKQHAKDERKSSPEPAKEAAQPSASPARLVSESTQTDTPLLQGSAQSKEDASAVDWNRDPGKSSKIHQLSRNGGSSLSREGMLKLLEQVQISAPLESQNASRMRHPEASSAAGPLRVSRQVSSLESMLFGDLAFC